MEKQEMDEYVVYHKPERMGYDGLSVDRLSVYTDHPVSRHVVGARVWLLAGEGERPRTYRLRGTFVIAAIEPSDNPEFASILSGKDGRLFAPMPRLNDEPWFPPFRESMGRFHFGFRRITDPKVLAGLRSVIAGRF